MKINLSNPTFITVCATYGPNSNKSALLVFILCLNIRICICMIYRYIVYMRDLRRHRAHYGITILFCVDAIALFSCSTFEFTRAAVITSH